MLRLTRARLADELGLDPGTTLRRMEREILTQDPALNWQPPPAAGLAPAYELGIGVGQRVVSAQVQGFAEVIGREEELRTLRARFTDPSRSPRPVIQVLTGLGGVGNPRPSA